MKYYTAQDTICLTLGQALVKFPTGPNSASGMELKDGSYKVCGEYWGHGNGIGTQPGARGIRPRPSLLPTLQRAIHGPRLQWFCQGQPAIGHNGLHLIHRTRHHQYAHRRCYRHHQPASRAAFPFRLLRHPLPGTGSAGTRSSHLHGYERDRLLSGCKQIFRSDHTSGTDIVLIARSPCGFLPTRPKPGPSP